MFKAKTGWCGGVKPDITFVKGGVTYLLDIGFSNNADIYYKAKKKKYDESTEYKNGKVVPIIF